MNAIGFMQGRLINKGGFYPQEFPDEKWEEEFYIGKKIGLNCIEWMFNADSWEKNPIIHADGMQAIKKISKETNIAVSGICLNYFMENCIYDDKQQEKNTKVIKKIIENAKKIACKYVVLPMFGASELDAASRSSLRVLKDVLREIGSEDICILLETNGNPGQVMQLIDETENSNIGICYDVGNAAGLGKDIIFELGEYGNLVHNVHLKDKQKNGTSVMLGNGDVPFHECFHYLSANGYEGCYILESYFDTNALYDTEINLKYVRENMKK